MGQLLPHLLTDGLPIRPLEQPVTAGLPLAFISIAIAVVGALGLTCLPRCVLFELKPTEPSTENRRANASDAGRAILRHLGGITAKFQLSTGI
jgi:hypothetical protein